MNDGIDGSRSRHPSSLPPPMDYSFTDTGQLVRYHVASACEGEPCPFHHPSAHAMVAWPMYVRTDLGLPLVERICAHGVGHPDPDSAAYFWLRGHTWVGVHGCDGCCQGESPSAHP